MGGGATASERPEERLGRPGDPPEPIQLRAWVRRRGRMGDPAPATAAGGAGPIGWVGVA
jgi:hypothetical protein